MLKMSAVYLEKKIYLFLKKIFFKPRVNSFNIKTTRFVYWPNFQWSFWLCPCSIVFIPWFRIRQRPSVSGLTRLGRVGFVSFLDPKQRPQNRGRKIWQPLVCNFGIVLLYRGILLCCPLDSARKSLYLRFLINEFVPVLHRISIRK